MTQELADAMRACEREVAQRCSRLEAAQRGHAAWRAQMAVRGLVRFDCCCWECCRARGYELLH